MHIILLGSPGAGKGTQAQFITEKYKIPFISSGEMLRAEVAAGTAVGGIAKEYLDRGELIPDPTMIDLIKDRLSWADCKNGYLLDGFPRTIPQARAFQENKISCDYVLEIYIPDEEAVRRLTGRRTHPASGRVYHIQFNPSKIPGIDDVTGEPLIQRDDDREDIIRKRLKVYHQKTEPLIKFYKKLQKKTPNTAPHYVRINGMGLVKEVWQRVLQVLVEKK